MIVRVRTNAGLWRVELEKDDSNATVKDIDMEIRRKRPNLIYTSPISLDPGCKEPLDAETTLNLYKISHGSMLHARVDVETSAELNLNVADANGSNPENDKSKEGLKVKRTIGKDGSILVSYEDAADSNDAGFRKGMRALRDIKMAWTLNEFMELVSLFLLVFFAFTSI